MKVYVGLDVSLASISICVVDETGTIVREGKVSCEPTTLPHSSMSRQAI
jgi:transposase